MGKYEKIRGTTDLNHKGKGWYETNAGNKVYKFNNDLELWFSPLFKNFKYGIAYGGIITREEFKLELKKRNSGLYKAVYS